MKVNAKLFLNRHSSTILTCLGATGVVITTITAVKATPKALELIKDEIDRQNHKLVKEANDAGQKNIVRIDKLHPLDVMRVAWKCYIPAALIGVGTITCIFGANFLNKHTQASLVSAYSLLDRSYKEYKDKVNDIYGEDSDEKIIKAIAKDKYSSIPFKVNEEKQLFYDMQAGRYFESTLADLYKAEYELNLVYAKYGYVSLNDFYDLIGIDRIKGGFDIGWSSEVSDVLYGYDCIEFEHEIVTLEDGLTCYVLMMLTPPTADYIC